MIEINLARTGGAATSSDISSPVSVLETDNENLAAVGRILALVMLPLVIYYYEGTIIDAKNEQLRLERVNLQNVKGQISKYGGAEKIVKQLHDEKIRLSSQIGVIKKISSLRSTKLKYMRVLQDTIPLSCWLTKISFKANYVEITGRATSTDAMQEFVNALSAPDKAVNVVNLGFNKVRIGKIDAYEYKLKSVISNEL